MKVTFMFQNNSKSIEACAAHYGEDSKAMREYLLNGERSALELDNRGPIIFEQDGSLSKDILEAYNKYGFYIFTGVIEDKELEEIKQDLEQMKKRFPVSPGAQNTIDGSPALGADCSALTLVWSKPLGDPLGGTELANGRHQVKLFEPQAADGAPEFIPFIFVRFITIF